jgi:hypothetical protein
MKQLQTDGAIQAHGCIIFQKEQMGKPSVPPQNAPYSLIATADNATLKLDNQKWVELGLCAPVG